MTDTYDTKVINMFGGSGIGKSTVAAKLFHDLKVMGKEVELVPEYAKEMVWEGRQPILDEQLYVFAKQYRRLSRLIGKVEYIITDSPITLGIVYTNPDYFKNLAPLIIEAHDSFNNINIVLERVSGYNNHGRQQTENEARLIDGKIRLMLESNNDHYTVVQVRDANTYKKLINAILEKDNG